MAIDLTSEQKAIGKANFHRAVGKLAEPSPSLLGLSRRQFMQGLVAAGATIPVAAAAYFGYNNRAFAGDPLKVGLIGAGDEGAVLVNEHNKEYLRFIAYSDVRPYNQKRIFDGLRWRDGKWEPESGRRGFTALYGRDARRNIRLYEKYEDLLKSDEIKAVVIALPLNLHYQATMDALDHGKHVLCEKLMAYNIKQCKEMIQKAKAKGLLLAVGHQRHYSMLYAHAVEALDTGVLGDIRHIRALWHRNNVRPVVENGQIVTDRETGLTKYRDSWRPDILPLDLARFPNDASVGSHGFKSLKELVRWRLFRRTGGGLMVELGSHQLDACSIFLGKRRDKDVHPIAVTGNGGLHFYRDHREVEDHVYCMFEFPGKNYDKNVRHHDGRKFLANDVVMVTYSSINTSPVNVYGECVMGSKGQLIAEGERDVMLYGASGANTAVTVTTTGGRPALDASASEDAGGPRAVETGQAALGQAPSKGYREEMEHFAYCVKMWNQGMARDREDLQPRCDGKSAMADAIMALAANQAIKTQSRIVFQNAWFDPDSPTVPDWDPPAEGV